MNDLSQPMKVPVAILEQLTKIKNNANASGTTTFSHADLVALEQQVVDENDEPWLSRLNSKNHDSNNEKIVRFIMFMNENENVFIPNIDIRFTLELKSSEDLTGISLDDVKHIANIPKNENPQFITIPLEDSTESITTEIIPGYELPYDFLISNNEDGETTHYIFYQEK